MHDINTNTIAKSVSLNKQKEKPIFIFGPCSAESENQVLKTAEEIAKNFDEVIFRAGIWKPRTRPGNFEGVGEKGLKWLKRVENEFGFEVCTEVANVKHLLRCVDNGIQKVWLGARTTVNPFMVQEIADGLYGKGLSVMIKNPIHPELTLWKGAVERIEQSGTKNISLIHRGFHYADNTPYRNLPKWDFAIEMKRLFPHYPVICDVSHICGTPNLIPAVAQKALDLAMDGLMIETHITPTHALSDNNQQVTPNELFEIINQLQFKSSDILNEKLKNELDLLRSKIDSIDEELLDKLYQRMYYVSQIGKYKKENNITIFQAERWNYILKRVAKIAKELNLSERFVKKLFNKIHDESIDIQEKVGKKVK